MPAVYFRLIQLGLKTLADIPLASDRAAVQALLDAHADKL